MTDGKRPTGLQIAVFVVAFIFVVVVVRAIYGYVAYGDAKCGFVHCVKVVP